MSDLSKEDIKNLARIVQIQASITKDYAKAVYAAYTEREPIIPHYNKIHTELEQIINQ